jgi:integrase
MPRRALTAASVGRIKPPRSGQVDHFDKGYPGLSLRVSYGGGKSWVFLYRIGGKLRRMTLGTYPAMGLAEARAAWREAREEVVAKRDPARKVERPSMIFSTVAEEWLRRDQAKNRSLHEIRRVVDRELISRWGDRSIADIHRRDVLDLLDALIDRGSPIMARRTHAHAHRLFGWAIKRGIIESNPAANMDRPPPSSRERVLTDDEIAQLWRAANQTELPFGPIFKLLLLTGARRMEIGGLRWSEIGDQEIILPGARTKNGIAHIIPLSAPAIAVIEQVPHISGTDFLFGVKPASGSWNRAKERLDAKIATTTPWRLHDIRRSVATGLQKLHIPLQVTEAVLGHTAGSRAGVVGIYQRHDYADEKRAALEAWGAHVMALVEGRAPGKVVPMRGTW